MTSPVVVANLERFAADLSTLTGPAGRNRRVRAA